MARIFHPEFNVRGLDGYSVRKIDATCWQARFNGHCFAQRKTAKGAVAAAYAEARFRANLAAGIKPEWMILGEKIAADFAH